MVDVLLGILMVLFPVSEIALAFGKRSRARVARSRDRGSLALLWLSIVVGLVLANLATVSPVGRVPVSPHVLRPAMRWCGAGSTVS